MHLLDAVCIAAGRRGDKIESPEPDTESTYIPTAEGCEKKGLSREDLIQACRTAILAVAQPTWLRG